MSTAESCRPLTIVISGAGGAGKGAIVDSLLKRDPRLWLSRSWTTRPRRKGESAEAYRFVTPEEFEEKLRAGGFLEWNQFFEHRYGTPRPEVPEGMDVVLEIDVQGAIQVRRVDPEAAVILVLPPSREEQRRRMAHRGDDDVHIAKRLAKSDAEESLGMELADLVVVNDDLDRAVGEVQAFIEDLRERHRRSSGCSG